MFYHKLWLKKNTVFSKVGRNRTFFYTWMICNISFKNVFFFRILVDLLHLKIHLSSSKKEKMGERWVNKRQKMSKGASKITIHFTTLKEAVTILCKNLKHYNVPVNNYWIFTKVFCLLLLHSGNKIVVFQRLYKRMLKWIGGKIENFSFNTSDLDYQ